MSELTLDLDESDDIGFVHQIRPIVVGVLRVVDPIEVYLVKVDSWFGDRWLSFSNKTRGALGRHRQPLRVPPFVPARVVSQRFFRRAPDEGYEPEETAVRLHVDQTSEDNARRLMSIVCPRAAVFWWSGETRRNQRGCLMAYLPTPEGHTGWYAEFKKVDDWRLANTLRTTVHELSSYTAGTSVAS